MSDSIRTEHPEHAVIYAEATGEHLNLSRGDFRIARAFFPSPRHRDGGGGGRRATGSRWDAAIEVLRSSARAQSESWAASHQPLRAILLGEESVVWDASVSAATEAPPRTDGQFLGSVIPFYAEGRSVRVKRSPDLLAIDGGLGEASEWQEYEGGDSIADADGSAISGALVVNTTGDVAALWTRRPAPMAGLRAEFSARLSGIASGITTRLRVQPYTWAERSQGYGGVFSLAPSTSVVKRSGSQRIVAEMPPEAWGFLVAVETEAFADGEVTVSVERPRLLTSTASGLSLARLTLPPSGFAWNPPFNLVRGSDGRYQVDPDFDLRAYAGVAVTTTVYVDSVSGSDANDGLLRSTPFQTLSSAFASGAERIVLLDGTYVRRADVGVSPQRDIEIIGEGEVYITADRSESVGAWSPVVGRQFAYQASISGGQEIARVYDGGVLTTAGEPTQYLVVTSVQEVEDTAGSLYFNAMTGVLYLHTLTDDDPTGRGDLIYYDRSSIYANRNWRYYIENVNFRGGLTFQAASSAGTSAGIYLKNCTGNALVILGVEAFLQGCRFTNAHSDIANYDVLHGLDCYVAEIDSYFGHNGLAGHDQASTLHAFTSGASVYAACVGSSYVDAQGQCIADAGPSSYRWMLSCELSRSRTGVGLYTEGWAWLDGCVIDQPLSQQIDLQTTGDGRGHIFFRGLTSGGHFDGEGELGEY